MLNKIALTILIIGGLNWGLVGLFRLDVIGWLFGGSAAMISRILYVLVAAAAVWCVSLLFKENSIIDGHHERREVEAEI